MAACGSLVYGSEEARSHRTACAEICSYAVSRRTLTRVARLPLCVGMTNHTVELKTPGDFMARSRKVRSLDNLEALHRETLVRADAAGDAGGMCGAGNTWRFASGYIASRIHFRRLAVAASAERRATA